MILEASLNLMVIVVSRFKNYFFDINQQVKTILAMEKLKLLLLIEQLQFLLINNIYCQQMLAIDMKKFSLM
jgi:hypothetical protein